MIHRFSESAKPVTFISVRLTRHSTSSGHKLEVSLQ